MPTGSLGNSPFPFPLRFFHCRLNSLVASLRLCRLVNQSKEVTLLTNWQSLKILRHSFCSKDAHQVFGNGNFSRTIADRYLHSNAISLFDLCSLADHIFDPKKMPPTSNRIEAR